MKFDYCGTDIRVPFSLLRALTPDLDILAETSWQDSPLTRAVFHRPGRDGENLSERQSRVAFDYAVKINQDIVLKLAAFPTDPDSRFIEWFGSEGRLKVEVSLQVKYDELMCDRNSEDFHNVIAGVKDGTLPPKELATYVGLLLSYGDSWTAKLVADAYLGSVDEVDVALADALGLSYALQGDIGAAKLLWERWLTASPIDEARARYSLSMLQARHNPRALLDPAGAEKNLMLAWKRLQEEPATPQTEYESVFNRNGMALLLFRKKNFAEARAVLEAGIAALESSDHAEKLHHTVLTSNLARVVKSMGDLQAAERLFREAIAMDPEFAEYHQDLASFLSDLGRFEEAAVEAERTVELDPSMPEAHRLLGYVLMQMGEPRRARDEYAKAASLGDDEAALDMLRASYEAETPEWTVQFSSRAAQAELEVKSKAEVELLLTQAWAALDPSMDVQGALNDLQARFPDDELIEEAMRLNENPG